MKMYIFVKDVVPDNFVPVVTAHASLSCYLKYEFDYDMCMWVNTSFKKVICCVNEEEFNELLLLSKHNITFESSLDGIDVAITFCPRQDSKMFRKYKLWKPRL